VGEYEEIYAISAGLNSKLGGYACWGVYVSELGTIQ